MKNPFHDTQYNDVSTSTVNINRYNDSIYRTLHHMLYNANVVRAKSINNGEIRFMKLLKDL